MKKEDELKHSARRRSIQEGIFATIKSSFGDRYISPFAIALGLSNSLVAFLSSISGLFGPISQIFGSKLMEKQSRKKIVTKFVLLEALSFLFLVFIAFLYLNNIIITSIPILFIAFFIYYTIIINIPSPAWFSWMGDIVDEEYRGRWFSKRNTILSFISIIFTLLSSFFLDFMKKNNFVFYGFIILFLLAMLSRLISWRIFHKQYEPKIKIDKKIEFSFLDFLKKAPKSNFGKFTFFRAFFFFSTSIAGSLITVYLLRFLKLSYTDYMLIVLSGTFFSIIALDLWGKLIDVFGNYKILIITSIPISFIPVLYSLSPNIFYLLFVPSLISGIGWAGFNLASQNMIYDNVSREKRGLVLSYFNLLNGIGIFFGAGAGSLLIKYLNTSFIQPIFLIFIISTLLRLLSIIIFAPRIKEVRVKKKKSIKEIEHFVIREFPSSIHEEFRQISSIGRYLRQ